MHSWLWVHECYVLSRSNAILQPFTSGPFHFFICFPSVSPSLRGDKRHISFRPWHSSVSYSPHGLQTWVSASSLLLWTERPPWLMFIYKHKCSEGRLMPCSFVKQQYCAPPPLWSCLLYIFGKVYNIHMNFLLWSGSQINQGGQLITPIITVMWLLCKWAHLLAGCSGRLKIYSLIRTLMPVAPGSLF